MTNKKFQFCIDDDGIFIPYEKDLHQHKLINTVTLETREDKINFILIYGSDQTYTKYTREDLEYKKDLDLDFTIKKIIGN